MSLPDGFSNIPDVDTTDNNGNNGNTGTDDVIAVTSIELDTIIMGLSLIEGETFSATLRATVLPENATDKTVHWISTNPRVAEVVAAGEGTEGLVTAVGAGTAIVMAISGDGGKVVPCAVTVTAPDAPPPDPDVVHVTGVSLSQHTLTLLTEDAGIQLTATVVPEEAVNQAMHWMSTNIAVAVVDNGLVTAGGTVGSAIIVVTTDDGSKIDFCQVTVQSPPPPDDVSVTGVSLTPSSVNLKPGQNQVFTAAVLPANASQQVTWESADTTVATVSESGVVIARSSGAATVIARSVRDPAKQASRTVTVGDWGNIGATVTTGDGSFTLAWNGSDLAFEGLEITVYEGAETPLPSPLHSETITGSGPKTFTLNQLTNGVPYTVAHRARYVGGYASSPTTQTVTPRMQITETDLSAFIVIPAPVTGASAVLGSISSPTQYTISLSWLNSSLAADGKFKAGSPYRPRLTLTAGNGYTFHSLTLEDFSYNGVPFSDGSISTSSLSSYIGASTITGTVSVSGAIRDGLGDGIGDVQVLLKRNGIPVYSPSQSTSPNGAYTIGGVTEGTYTVFASLGDIITESAPFTVVYTSVSTMDLVINNPITQHELHSFAAKPERGVNSTNQTIDTPAQYVVERVWKRHAGGDHTGFFLAGIAYDAHLTLKAKEGFAFPTTIALGDFTYTPPIAIDGLLITNLLVSADMKTAQVLVQFPATETVSISGTIVDSVGTPVEGASVQLRFGVGSEEYNTGVLTDAVGKYSIDGVKAGAYNILVSKAGYASSRIPANNNEFITIEVNGVSGQNTVLKRAITPDYLDVSTLFPAPVPGDAPVTTPNALEHTEFSVLDATITWRTAAGAPFTGPVFGQTSYKATFTLIPATTYSFSGFDSTSFSYSNWMNLINRYADIGPHGSSATITVTFAAPDFSTAAVHNAGEFTQRLDWIKANGQRGVTYPITLADHIALEPQVLTTTGASSGLAGVTINIQGAAGEKKISLATDTGTLFDVTGSVANPLTLILDANITLDGCSATDVTGCDRDLDDVDNNVPFVIVGSNATVTMQAGSKIAGNTNAPTASYARGGAVQVNSGGRFYLEGGEIYGNTARSAGAGSQAWGGGIYNNGGTVIVSTGTIKGNTAAAPSSASAYGGGIYNSGGTVIISNGVISYNTVTVNSGNVYGGGIYNSGGTVIMSNGEISYNTAAANSGSGIGGGIFSQGQTAVLTVSGGTISNNTVTGPNGAQGGGIYSAANTLAMLTVSGVVVVSNNSVSGDSAYGGGMYAGNISTVTLESGSAISNNTATASNTNLSSGYSAHGGGIYAAGALSTITLKSGSAISNNTATASGISTISSGVNINRSALGGGMYASNSITVTLESGSEINHNSVTVSDSGTNASNSHAYGGGIYANGSNNITITLKSGSQIHHNSATVSGTGTGTTINRSAYGGGMYVNTSSPVTTITLENNSQIHHNSAAANGTGAADGGGVYAVGSLVNVTGGILSDNSTEGSIARGGALYIGMGANSSLRLSSGTISNNTASSHAAASSLNAGGGGICSQAAFQMSGGDISGNTASSIGSGGNFGGGGVYMMQNAPSFTMTGGTIGGNQIITSSSTGSGGGGVYVYNGNGTSKFTKTGGIIYGDNTVDSDKNTASNGAGHAVYVYSPSRQRNTEAGNGVNLDSTNTNNWE
ncbi:MAG: Ig-like domain-containing protein [Spirochaetaceae bacterium]|nr:Ig-like domain-containing protein [Spirochaetaceae bacterium]